MVVGDSRLQHGARMQHVDALGRNHIQDDEAISVCLVGLYKNDWFFTVQLQDRKVRRDCIGRHIYAMDFMYHQW